MIRVKMSFVRFATRLARELNHSGYEAYVIREGTVVQQHTRGSYRIHRVCETSAPREAVVAALEKLRLNGTFLEGMGNT